MHPSRMLPTAVMLGGLSLATAAHAHAHLRAADPGVDSALRQRPAAVRVVFTQPVVAAFSGLQLADGAGRTVEAGKASVDPRDRRALVLPLRSPLTPGRYTVRWRAVTSDSHRVEGRYSFRVVG